MKSCKQLAQAPWIYRIVASAVAVLMLPTDASAKVIDTSTEKFSDFENGLLNPFQPGLAFSPNFIKNVTPAFGAAEGTHATQSYWAESGYNGTRSYRGAEMSANITFQKEGWEGFSLYVPSVGYPQDKTATIAQIFDGGGSTQASSWCGMLEIRNNDLWIEHRGNAAAPADHIAKVMSNLQRDKWVRVVIHFVASRIGKGSVQVWVDNKNQNTPTYSATNINVGYGDWDTAADSLVLASSLSLKLGMYNWDVGNYLNNETRTLYYDAIHQLNSGGNAGFAAVAPVPEPTVGLFIALGGMFSLRRSRCRKSSHIH